MAYQSFPFKLVGTLTFFGSVFLIQINSERFIDAITFPVAGWVRLSHALKPSTTLTRTHRVS